MQSYYNCFLWLEDEWLLVTIKRLVTEHYSLWYTETDYLTHH